MAIIKCKMCGGDIVLSEDRTYGTCEYCGSTMTFPKVSDEQRLNLFNRANHFRRQNEFDKAIAAYEKILEQDDTDAEAHWGAVLSRYGIEYVEDPVTHERIPTCHRVQLQPILTDGDYLDAVKHAPDTASRDIYEKEARRIADIQKGILAISSREKPYDVFICYKESDDSGSRTVDSTLAQEIYYQLTNEGYKVFFSRITLEDKLGQEYEPYIFAALNSAKVMLVVGTKPENFNAVWVKNEWSRYLDLMKSDRSKLLIPCYRDMDPYDLPEALSALQSQNMSKIGFMQDIIRGVKKVLYKEVSKSQSTTPPTTVMPVNNATALIKRAFLALEDGDFTRADDFCEQALNQDPENSRAYLGKLMIDLKVCTESDLKNCAQPFDRNNNYKKVIRFGDEALRKQVKKDIEHIKARNEHDRQKMIYYRAVEALRKAETVEQCANARLLMQTIPEYEGISKILLECDAKIEAINNRYYCQAEALQKEGKWQEAIKVYRLLKDYKDSPQRIGECAESIRADTYKRAERLKTQGKWDDASAIFERLGQYRDCYQKSKECQELKEAARQAEIRRKEAEKREIERQARLKIVRRRRIKLSVVAVIVIVIALSVLYNNTIKPSIIYRKAIKAMESGNYSEATFLFKSIEGYEDAAAQALESQYQQALSMYANSNYDEAITEFKSIETYKDSMMRVRQIEADKLFTMGFYDKASSIYAELDMAYQTYAAEYEGMYTEAKDIMAQGNYEDAAKMFSKLGNYSDATTQEQECNYQEAALMLKNGDYVDACALFTSLGDYRDAATQAKESLYQNAMKLNENGEYDDAYTIFAKLEGFKDVDVIIAQDTNIAAVKWKTQFKIGNEVQWGHYEQDNDTSNGAEAIDWIVLASDGDMVTLISKYGLAAKQYNTEYTSVTWETCTLRKWMNEEFLNTAFSSEEQAKIATVNVAADDNPDCSVEPGNDTQDKVFLLSINEANRYFSSDDDRQCIPTKAAKSNISIGVVNTFWWWLRTPGNNQSNTANVNYGGTVDCYGRNVRFKDGNVRPVIVLKIS